ncbi:MAG: reverse transcriptase domain-containing protein, partial [Pseudomonadota bacterium]
KKLNVSYNPDAQRLLEQISIIEQEEERNDEAVHFVFNTELMSDPGEPQTLEEALNGPEAEFWRPEAKKEVHNFIRRGNWRKCFRTKAGSEGRRIIQVKWVFKKKKEADGTIRYKCRIVVKGFMQVPGVDFTEYFSPVATDTTIRLFFIMVLWQKDWKCHMFDVEAAFLNAELDKPMYLEWPNGMVELGFLEPGEEKTTCIELIKSMYGNVDAALRWMLAFSSHLTEECGLIQSLADPCLFIKRGDNDELILLVVIYVDDVLIGGTTDEIKRLKDKVSAKYTIKDLGQLRGPAANDNFAPWLGVLKYAAVAAIAVAAWHFTVVPRIGDPQDGFRAASEASAEFVLQVRFVESATISDIGDLLGPIGGTITAGPSALGIVQVSFVDAASRDAAREVLAARSAIVDLISDD